LQIINGSAGDLAPVFEAMLEKAMRLSEAETAHLIRYENGVFSRTASRGVREDFDKILPLNTPVPHIVTRDSIPYRMVATRAVVHVHDSREDESVRAGAPDQTAAVASGIRTALFVPLLKEGEVVGGFVMHRMEVRPFTDKQIALIQNFAAQAVIAMENARLVAETREALEQQTATAEVLGVINSNPGNLTPVFDAMLEKATCLHDAAFGILSTISDSGIVSHRAFYGTPALAEVYGKRAPAQPPAGGTLDRLINGERCPQVDDATKGDLYLRDERRRVVELAGARTIISVGLYKDDLLVGAISLYRCEVRRFSEREIAVLENFAAQAVIAMENARLLGELRQRTDEVAELNRGLEVRVAEQVEELGRVGRLKRFLAPQLAELIVSQGDEKILESHRREIVVVFCDLRGYTAFTETAEPEEVLDFLREYHGALGPLVSQFEGTLDQFSGDGIMVFFNDPVPCPDPAEGAVKMAMAMREAAGTLIAAWRRRGRLLGFGAGIAQGYATLGQIGFADRSGYTAIGTVCNLAARLCAEAKDGQILVAQRVAVAVEEITPLEEVGELTLKGLTQPVVAYNLPLVSSQAAFRVIEGGAPSA
jgi:class 3 adenylate cyclase